MLRPLTDGICDVVYGSRFLKRSTIWNLHTVGNRVLTFISNLVNCQHLTDMETCYKLLPIDFLRRINLKCNRFGFEPEITAHVARRRLRVREVPISYKPRGYEDGKKIGLWDAIKAVITIVIVGLSR